MTKMINLPENWALAEKQLNEIEFDILKKMVVIEPSRRYSCQQLLAHPYFI